MVCLRPKQDRQALGVGDRGCRQRQEHDAAALHAGGGVDDVESVEPEPAPIRAKTDRQPAELVLCRYALAAAALDFEAERQDRGRRRKRRTVRDLERDAKLGSRHRRLAECSEGRARPCVRGGMIDREPAAFGPDAFQLDREEHHVMRGFEARRRRRHGRQDGTELDELRGRRRDERIDRALRRDRTLRRRREQARHRQPLVEAVAGQRIDLRVGDPR